MTRAAPTGLRRGRAPARQAPGGGRRSPVGRAALLLLVVVCGVGVPEAAPWSADAPSIFLGGASIPRAKALALDAALLKGWQVKASESDHVVFEILLDTPASAGPPDVVAGRAAPPAQTLLRIRADFTAGDSGVMTELRAEEIWYAGTPSEWRDDVTSPYRANLMNALQSLSAQWASIAPAAPADLAQGQARLHPQAADAPQRRGLFGLLPEGWPPATRSALPQTPAQGTARPAGGAPSAEPAPRRGGLFGLLPEGWPRRLSRSTSPPLSTRRHTAPIASVPTRATRGMAVPRTGLPSRSTATPGGGQADAPAPSDAKVGVWAYYAEAFATQHGCTLADRGAVLVGESEAGELHRVYCQNGSSVMVRCDRTSCGAGR